MGRYDPCGAAMADLSLSLTMLGHSREGANLKLSLDLFAICQSLNEVQNKLDPALVKNLPTPIDA